MLHRFVARHDLMYDLLHRLVGQIDVRDLKDGGLITTRLEVKDIREAQELLNDPYHVGRYVRKNEATR